MGVHLYTNGAWTDSGRIYRNSLNLAAFENKTQFVLNVELTISNGVISFSGASSTPGGRLVQVSNDIILPAGIYKFSANGTETYPSLILQSKTDSSLYFTTGQTVSIETEQTFYLSFSFSSGVTYNGTCRPMLNAGNTIFPYEPYNVVDWYTNHGHGYSSGAWD